VLEQLVFSRRVARASVPRRSRKRATDWAQRLEIADALAKRTEELSKGMQQKIQFIGSVLHDPGLIVMDEPFAGLDPVNATLLERTLLDFKDQGKAYSLLHPSHGPGGEAVRLHLLINNGEAVLAGRCAENQVALRAQPRYVEFEGSADFLSSAEIAGRPKTSPPRRDTAQAARDTQKLLHEATARPQSTASKLVEPSLERKKDFHPDREQRPMR